MLLATLTVLGCLLATGQTTTLRRIGAFSIKNPAFSTIYTNPNPADPKDKYNLLVSAFSAPSLFSSSSDSVHIVRDVGQFYENINGIAPELLTKDVIWPNEVSHVPGNILPGNMLAIPDGFLVPFKTAGSIKLLNMSAGANNELHTITHKDSSGDWFYHRVEWYDMDGDGDQDILTARAREPVVPILFGRKDEELLWLENPSGDVSKAWTNHVLAHGPDAYFRMAKLNTTNGTKTCIFAAQFFTESITVYWTTQDNDLFTDLSQLQHREIDASIGRVFEVDLADLNNDGKEDLLITTNGASGTLLAYEIPDDFRTGKYIKHTIGVDFKPRTSGQGKGAPGSAMAVQPVRNNANVKPTILLSGDDDGRAYMFEPVSQAADDWTYTKVEFCDAGSGTVGELSAADINGDGYLEVFVPSYSTNEVIVYTSKPAMDQGILVGR